MLKILDDSGVKQVGRSRNQVKTREALGTGEEKGVCRLGLASPVMLVHVPWSCVALFGVAEHEA